MPVLPIMLKVQDRKIVIVGGGRVASRRVQTFLEDGALVKLIAPSISSEIKDLASENGALTLLERAYRPEDLDGAWLVLAHTNVPAVQHEIAKLCQARNIWCLVGGDPEESDFWMMSHRQVETAEGELTIAVSGGGNPKLAKNTVEDLRAYLTAKSDTCKK